jgi:hypothetical protein
VLSLAQTYQVVGRGKGVHQQKLRIGLNFYMYVRTSLIDIVYEMQFKGCS